MTVRKILSSFVSYRARIRVRPFISAGRIESRPVAALPITGDGQASTGFVIKKLAVPGLAKIAMTGTRRSRKLAVILHADVVGSTAMVQRDAALAHDRIDEVFRRLGTVISAYHGRVRELRGDALVAQFELVADAVAAALKFQQEQKHYLEQLGDDFRTELRIGIALGEVVTGSSTITGAGVVLAQRVEQLALPGGLCITAAIHENLPKRLPFDEENLGEIKLKGFDDAMRVYRVAMRTGEAIPMPERIGKNRLAQGFMKTGRAIGIIALVIGGGAAISSGFIHFRDLPGATPHWLAPASESARLNPVKSSLKSIELGTSLYQQNCVSCHGANAEGNGINARKLNPRPANLKAMSQSHADGEFAYKIRVGRGAMPGWETTLNEAEIWNLVNFIQTLNRQPADGNENVDAQR